MVDQKSTTCECVPVQVWSPADNETGVLGELGAYSDRSMAVGCSTVPKLVKIVTSPTPQRLIHADSCRVPDTRSTVLIVGVTAGIFGA